MHRIEKKGESLSVKTPVRIPPSEAAEVSALALLILFGPYVPIPFLEKILAFPVDLMRIGVDMYTAVYLFRRIRRKSLKDFSPLFLVTMGVLGFWLVYGCAGALISPYTTAYQGFVYMSKLFWNVLTVYCVFECCHTLRRVKVFLSVLGVSCAALIFLSLAESFAGFHWAGSELYDPGTYFNGVRNVPAGLYLPTLFVSTVMECNCNNTAAMIAILLPALFVTGQERRWEQILCLMLTLLGLYVMIVNDANVCIVALFASVIVFTLLHRKSWKWNLGMLMGDIALTCGGAAYITNGLIAVKRHFWQAENVALTNDFFNSGVLLWSATLTDPGAMQVGQGSLGVRLNICRDMWDMSVGTHFLGSGPRGYGWFDTHPLRTAYIDPHCWYLEVLSQYGIVVFLSYFGSLVYMYVQMIRAYLRNKETAFAVVVAMCTAFVFACIAPSSFLRFSYAWILPGLCLALLRLDAEKQ